MQVTFTFAQLNVHIHATEDAEKILRTLSDRLKIDANFFTQTKALGHFGNPILIYSVSLRGESANSFAANLLSELDPLDKSSVREEVWKYIDDRGDLHLRLDKQSLFGDRVRLGLSDVVRIRLRAGLTGLREQLLSAYQSLL